MDSIGNLVEDILEAGKKASTGQARVHRSYKNDGTVLTRSDTEIDRFLGECIADKYPYANIISEESGALGSLDKEYTFAVDPIDGTDAYSQGLPGWCVSIGVLDAFMIPVAGLVFAPQWGGSGTLIVADLDKPPICNGEPVVVTDDVGRLGNDSQIMIGSKIHRSFRLRSFPGKIRGSGSFVINAIAPLLHTEIVGSLQNPAYIWDTAGAHAILKSLGMTMECFHGAELTYPANRESSGDFLLSGTKNSIRFMRRYLAPLKKQK